MFLLSGETFSGHSWTEWPTSWQLRCLEVSKLAANHCKNTAFHTGRLTDRWTGSKGSTWILYFTYLLYYYDGSFADILWSTYQWLRFTEGGKLQKSVKTQVRYVVQQQKNSKKSNAFEKYGQTLFSFKDRQTDRRTQRWLRLALQAAVEQNLIWQLFRWCLGTLAFRK